jgi:hypothetical protein
LTGKKDIPGTDLKETLTPNEATAPRELATPESPFGQEVELGGVNLANLSTLPDLTGGFGNTGDFPFLPGNNAQGGRIRKYQEGGSIERMMAAIQGDDLSSRLDPMSIYIDRIEKTPYTTFGGEEDEDADLRKIIDQAIADYNKKQKEEEDVVKESDDTDKETETEEAPKTEEAPDTEESAETEETEEAEETEETEEGAMGMKYMGEEGFKTEGEFNHDTNKKAVIDEEDGTKEAELTGGELVFNPKQANTMEKLIEEDNPRGLLKFLKNLLSKPQFKD